MKCYYLKKMASSPTPSLDSLPGGNSLGSFGEANDYLSDSPLTLSGSSPPVSDSAICDDFNGLTTTSSLDSNLLNSASSGLSSCGDINNSGYPRCTGCKSKQSDAVAKCIDCVNYLCANCVTAHQFMHCFDGHTVFRISDSVQQQQQQQNNINSKMNGFESQSRLATSLSLKDDSLTKSIISNVINDTNGTSNKGSSYFCTRHKSEILKFFCRTCQVSVCKDCIVMEHPSGLHDCEHIADTTPKQIESLMQIVSEVRGKAADMRVIIKNAEHNSARISVQYHKAQNEIQDTFQFYRSMLDERKQELLKELESFYNAKNMSQSVQLTKSQEHVDKVLQSCEFVERLLKHAGLAETIMLRKLMENKLQSFLSYIQELQSSFELDFVSNYQAIQVGVRNTFGYIRCSSEQASKQPPIARPTSNNQMSNGCLSTNGSSPSSSSSGSINQNSLTINGLHSNGLDRQYNHSNGNNNQQHTSSSISSSFDSNIISKRFNSANSLGPFVNDPNLHSNPYEKWSNGGSDNIFNNLSDQYTIPITTTTQQQQQSNNTDSMIDLTSKLMTSTIFPPKSQIKRQKMIYHCKFGEFGVLEGQFTEPSGVAVNAQNDIIVADTNNHRIQIFDKEGRFKFQFGECGKRDGQLLYPNRVAVVRNSGDIIVTERSPTHQIQIYNQYGQFVRKFGANILQHPRGVTVDNKGHIIVVECKVMRVIIFDQSGNVLQKFGCSKHLEFPNGVVVNDKQEIFISDNRAHCVKVFNYEGVYLRQIGGEGITNYPIGVGINATGEILIADNHNNFNLTIFTQDGQMVSALESKVKHAQCFDVALMDDGSVVLASKDYRLYIYRYVQQFKGRCSVEEFAVFFLNFLRSQTEEFTKGNSSTCNTPRKITGIYDDDYKECNKKLSSRDLFQASGENKKLLENGFEDSNNSWRLYDDSKIFDDQKFNTPIRTKESSILNTSTPKNDSTPQKINIARRSLDIKSSINLITPKKSQQGICLGDFIVTNSRSSKKLNNSSTISEKSFNNSDCDKTSQQIRPKRRVVPTTITTNRNEFISSPFKSDNNLINFGTDEKEISTQNNFSERNFLRTQKQSITKDFQDEQSPNSMILHRTIRDTIVSSASKNKSSISSESIVDLTKITNKSTLTKLIRIHSLILDLNLITNILTEISYLLNLLNAENEPTDLINQNLDQEREMIDPYLINKFDSSISDLENIFKNLNNCIFFALGVLNTQRHILALLDTTTLKVLIDNERLGQLDLNFKVFLQSIQSHKIKLETMKITENNSFKLNNKINNVFYQEENDTKENFPSENEFGGFKKQRDMFYMILRDWELKHLNPSFDFNTDLSKRVISLLRITDHPINMAHLAKLFVAQLIVSCNFDDSAPELQMALPNIDLNKLSKLRQRLITPSHFSTEYLFPGNQSFFRDFIIAVENQSVFIEQLKVALICDLLEINNSSYETLNLSNSDNKNSETEFFVRPELITTLRVLAKFIGFIIAQPFNYDGQRNISVDNKQIVLRNSIQQNFDVKSILIKSIIEKKLIITIPWLVQYLTMLDYVTLRLNYFKDVLNILYELYILSSSLNDKEYLAMRPTSKFILRSCLGWLFENPSIPEEYYKYHQNRSSGIFQSLSSKEDYVVANVLVPCSISEHFLSEFPLRISQFDKNGSSLECVLQLKNNENICKTNKTQNEKDVNFLTKSMHPLLENILNVACPFLADFRVSIMPSKMSKTVSRTGRYRHITTKLADSTIPVIDQSRDVQKILADEFLQSQSLSVRKTVDFIIERTTSAVIKDFQIEFLLNSKKKSENEIKLITTKEPQLIVQEVYNIYTNSLQELTKEWNANIPKMLKERIIKAFDALLPNETLNAVKLTCVNLAYQKSIIKTTEWRITNCSSVEIYSKDIRSDVRKLIKNDLAPTETENLDLFLNENTPSFMFDRLQNFLHLASARWDFLDYRQLNIFLIRFSICLQQQGLVPLYYKTAGYMILQLATVLICNRPDFLTPELTGNLIKIWRNEKMISFTTIQPPMEIEVKESVLSPNPDEPRMKLKLSSYIFANLISPSYIKMLEFRPKEVYETFERFIGLLLQAKLVTIDILNEQCVALFTQEWSERVLFKLSVLMKSLTENNQRNINSRNYREGNDKESHLFMQMLSEMSRDMEDF